MVSGSTDYSCTPPSPHYGEEKFYSTPIKCPINRPNRDLYCIYSWGCQSLNVFEVRRTTFQKVVSSVPGLSNFALANLQTTLSFAVCVNRCVGIMFAIMSLHRVTLDTKPLFHSRSHLALHSILVVVTDNAHRRPK